MTDPNKAAQLHAICANLAGVIDFFMTPGNKVMNIKHHTAARREMIRLGVGMAEIWAGDLSRIAEAVEYQSLALGKLISLIEEQNAEKIAAKVPAKAVKRSFIGMNADPVRETTFHVADDGAVTKIEQVDNLSKALNNPSPTVPVSVKE